MVPARERVVERRALCRSIGNADSQAADFHGSDRLAFAQGAAGRCSVDHVRSYKEILRVLIIRDQLLLGWKIGFFIVCGALLVGSMTLMRVNVRSVDLKGTVISHRTDTTETGSVTYLIVQLDSGVTVRARNVGPLDYRPGQRGVVREVTTNFFGLKKHEFKGYLDKPRGE